MESERGNSANITRGLLFPPTLQVIGRTHSCLNLRTYEARAI